MPFNLDSWFMVSLFLGFLVSLMISRFLGSFVSSPIPCFVIDGFLNVSQISRFLDSLVFVFVVSLSAFGFLGFLPLLLVYLLVINYRLLVMIT